MASPDPDFWQEAAKWLWGILALPLGIVWKKVDGAASRDELTQCMGEIKQVIKDHAADDEQMRRESRETFIKIFERMDKQGEVLNRVDATISFMRERRD